MDGSNTVPFHPFDPHEIHLNEGHTSAVIAHLKCNLVNFEIPNRFLYYGNDFGISKLTRLHFKWVISWYWHVVKLNIKNFRYWVSLHKISQYCDINFQMIWPYVRFVLFYRFRYFFSLYCFFVFAVFFPITIWKQKCMLVFVYCFWVYSQRR